MEALAGIEQVAALPGFGTTDSRPRRRCSRNRPKFCQDVIAPLNWAGDQTLVVPGRPRHDFTPGFKGGLRAVHRRWLAGVIHPVEHGSQGFPELIATACTEMLRVQPVVRAVPDADRWRDRGLLTAQRRAQGQVTPRA